MITEDYREANRAARWGIGWILAAALIIALIGVAAWGFSVLTAPVKGRGDAVKIREDGANRVAAQERFETLYADVIAADKRITVMHDALKAQPKSAVAQTNYTGSVTYCLSVVADYDAEARKYSARDFRAIDLPEQIDDQDPATDCKEN